MGEKIRQKLPFIIVTHDVCEILFRCLGLVIEQNPTAHYPAGV